MKRRDFLTLIGAVVAWSPTALAQDSHKRPLVGYLTGAAQPPNPYSDIFVQGMRSSVMSKAAASTSHIAALMAIRIDCRGSPRSWFASSLMSSLLTRSTRWWR